MAELSNCGFVAYHCLSGWRKKITMKQENYQPAPKCTALGLQKLDGNMETKTMIHTFSHVDRDAHGKISLYTQLSNVVGSTRDSCRHLIGRCYNVLSNVWLAHVHISNSSLASEQKYVWHVLKYQSGHHSVHAGCIVLRETYNSKIQTLIHWLMRIDGTELRMCCRPEQIYEHRNTVPTAHFVNTPTLFLPVINRASGTNVLVKLIHQLV